jgi:hypothetical protein
MKTHARVVVIGGGVVGVSTLYHLALKGWTDVVLLERAELTAGSTWHAAGLLPLFNMSYTVGQLHKYSVDLYKRLPAETGQDVSFHVTGNLRLATCRDRMDEYQKYCGTANTIGVPFQVIGPQESSELWPLIELGDGADTPKIIGALYHPDDGHIAPADLTMALRKGARAAAAPRSTSNRSHRREAHASGRVAPDHQQGRHHRRARGVRHRQLRAPDRTPVRLNVPSIPGRAPIHRVRRIARTQGLSPGRRPRARGAARIGPVLLPARGAHGLDLGALRSRRAGALCRRRARLVRQEPVRGRPRAIAAACRGRAAPRALARQPAASRTSSTVRSPTPRRQPADRSRLGRAQSVAQRGPQLRHHRGRRLRLAAGRMDRRGRARHRHDGGRSAPLRSLHQQALRGAEERGDLPQRLRHSLSRRRARRRASRQDQPGVRQARPHGRGVRPALRLGARQLVRAPGDSSEGQWSFRRSNYFEHVGNEALHAPRCRRHRPDAVHQARGDRTRRGSLARRPGRQQGADQDRPHRALPRAHPPRRHSLRVHHHQDRRAALLRGERRRRRALRQRLPAADAARRRQRHAAQCHRSRGVFVVAGPRSREVLAKLTDAPLDNAAFPWLTGQVAEVGLATTSTCCA